MKDKIKKILNLVAGFILACLSVVIIIGGVKGTDFSDSQNLISSFMTILLPFSALFVYFIYLVIQGIRALRITNQENQGYSNLLRNICLSLFLFPIILYFIYVYIFSW